MLLPAFPLLSVGHAAPGHGAFPAGGRPAHLFARGRFALFEGLRLLAAARGLRRVWLPAYLCCPVVETVEALGLEPRLYDVDPRLTPRLPGITPRPGDGLLLVHYFGLAQPLDRLAAICREHGMMLIEDCAHILPDPTAEHPVGSRGDVAMFSLRKQVPVPAGGVLVVNDPALAPLVRTPAVRGLGDVRTLAKAGLMVVERMAFALGWNVLPLKDRLPVLDARERAHTRTGAASEYAAPPPPSRLIPAMLPRTRWDAVVRWRRDSYARLADRLGRLPALHLPLPEAPDGSAPHALPVWTEAPGVVVRRLRRQGVEAMCWPGSEQLDLAPGAFPGTEAWLRQSLCLPLGVPLTGRRLDRFVGAVARAVDAAARAPVAGR